MSWHAHVHTPLSSDTEPSVIVSFSNAKYVFNASDNTGRASVQNATNFRRTSAMFFTHVGVDRTSALSTMIMGFADASTATKLAIRGPPGTTHLLASMRTYTYRDVIDIQANDVPLSLDTLPCYKDDNVSVYAIPAIPFSSSSIASVDTPMDISSEKRKRSLTPDSPNKRVKSDSLSRPPSPRPSTAASAESLRQRLIRAMFPNTVLPPSLDEKKRAEHKQRSRKGTKKSQDPEPAAIPAEDMNIDVDSQRTSRTSLPDGFHKQLPRFIPPTSYTGEHGPPTLSYLVVGPQYRGKFDAEKAKALGLERHNRGKVANGETVTYTVKVGDEMVERTVGPEDVLGKNEAPSAVLILDIPSVEHIPSLINSFRNSEMLRKIWDDASPLGASNDDMSLRGVYHMLGDGVLEDDSYKAFMRAFSPDVHHMIASRKHCEDRITFTSSAHLQLTLNALDEEMFPRLHHSTKPQVDLKDVPNLPPNVQPMLTSLRLPVRPFAPPTLDYEGAPEYNFYSIVSGQKKLEIQGHVRRAIGSAQRDVQAKLKLGGDGGEGEGEVVPRVLGKDVGVIPLGTGGSMPSKYRNVLSTLIRIPGWGNIILDAGEGTWGQLARLYGLSSSSSSPSSSAYTANQALHDLKCIFISHIHGDHHVGIAKLLARRAQLDPKPEHPLYVVAGRNTHLYLRELQDLQDLGLETNESKGELGGSEEERNGNWNGVIPILSESLHEDVIKRGAYFTTGVLKVLQHEGEGWLDYQRSSRNAKRMCDSLGLQYFRTADVFHRCRCYGCSFKHKDGWSVTFSGDTMPCGNLVKIGRNSTVLIHEATMADDEAAMARQKSHSTIGQAISIGRQMNARHTLLTHFSARHPKLPPPTARRSPSPGTGTANANHGHGRRQEGIVVPALDYANMTIGNMWKMEHYVQVPEAIFAPWAEVREKGRAGSGSLLGTRRSASPLAAHGRSRSPSGSHSQVGGNAGGSGLFRGGGGKTKKEQRHWSQSPSRAPAPSSTSHTQSPTHVRHGTGARSSSPSPTPSRVVAAAAGPTSSSGVV